MEQPPPAAAPTPPGPEPAWARPKVNWVRVAATVLACLIPVIALLRPSGYDVFVPGEAPNAEAKVTVNAPVQHRAGSIHLLTVGVYYGVREWAWLGAQFNPQYATYPLTVYPNDPHAEASAMDTSQRDGEVAAFGELYGYQSLKSDGLLVVATTSNTSAARLLRSGDVIAEADGHSLATATASSDLGAIVQAHALGQPVHLSIIRGGQRLAVDPVVVANPDPRPPGPKKVIGVSIEPDYQLPVPVKIDAGGISGPSAGLSWALAIVNLLGPHDLTRGRVVADTGTMDYQGNVGAIGGIQQKVYGAERIKATVLICPVANVADAKATLAASHYQMTVYGVTTLHEAVVALSAP